MKGDKAEKAKYHFINSTFTTGKGYSSLTRSFWELWWNKPGIKLGGPSTCLRLLYDSSWGGCITELTQATPQLPPKAECMNLPQHIYLHHLSQMGNSLSHKTCTRVVENKKIKKVDATKLTQDHSLKINAQQLGHTI